MTDQNSPNRHARPTDAPPADARPADAPPADARPANDDYDAHQDYDTSAIGYQDGRGSLREDVISRERSRFGGIKVGSAFFGWIAAMGIAVLLTALVAATGAAIGLGASGSTDKAVNDANANAATVGLWGAIALAVIAFVSYYCGGYVAGRMARFNGIAQGLFVWFWAVLVAIIVAIVTAIAGSQYNILGNVNGFPRIPIDEGTMTAASIITAIVVAILSLIGALLGGLAGMHFHRKVDRAGLGD